MSFDFTISIALIISISTIFANVITSYLTNKQQINLKRFEKYEMEKRQVLQNFINISVDCFNSNNDWSKNKEFVKSLYSLQLYFKSANYKMIDKINKVISSNQDKDNIKITFIVVINKLAKEIKKR